MASDGDGCLQRRRSSDGRWLFFLNLVPTCSVLSGSLPAAGSFTVSTGRQQTNCLPRPAQADLIFHAIDDLPRRKAGRPVVDVKSMAPTDCRRCRVRQMAAKLMNPPGWRRRISRLNGRWVGPNDCHHEADASHDKKKINKNATTADFFGTCVYGAHRRSRRSRGSLLTEATVWRRFSRTHLTALITLSGTASKWNCRSSNGNASQRGKQVRRHSSRPTAPHQIPAAGGTCKFEPFPTISSVWRLKRLQPPSNVSTCHQLTFNVGADPKQ